MKTLSQLLVHKEFTQSQIFKINFGNYGSNSSTQSKSDNFSNKQLNLILVSKEQYNQTLIASFLKKQ